MLSNLDKVRVFRVTGSLSIYYLDKSEIIWYYLSQMKKPASQLKI
jgi:hypothetical protein